MVTAMAPVMAVDTGLRCSDSPWGVAFRFIVKFRSNKRKSQMQNKPILSDHGIRQMAEHIEARLYSLSPRASARRLPLDVIRRGIKMHLRECENHGAVTTDVCGGKPKRYPGLKTYMSSTDMVQIITDAGGFTCWRAYRANVWPSGKNGKEPYVKQETW